MTGSALFGSDRVWLADCARDRGAVTSTSSCPRPFESIDIFVDNGDDDVMDAVTYNGTNRFEGGSHTHGVTMGPPFDLPQDCARGRSFGLDAQLLSVQYLPATDLRPVPGERRVTCPHAPHSDWCIE